MKNDIFHIGHKCTALRPNTPVEATLYKLFSKILFEKSKDKSNHNVLDGQKSDL